MKSLELKSCLFMLSVSLLLFFPAVDAASLTVTGENTVEAERLSIAPPYRPERLPDDVFFRLESEEIGGTVHATLKVENSNAYPLRLHIRGGSMWMGQAYGGEPHMAFLVEKNYFTVTPHGSVVVAHARLPVNVACLEISEDAVGTEIRPPCGNVDRKVNANLSVDSAYRFIIYPYPIIQEKDRALLQPLASEGLLMADALDGEVRPIALENETQSDALVYPIEPWWIPFYPQPINIHVEDMVTVMRLDGDAHTLGMLAKIHSMLTEMHVAANDTNNKVNVLNKYAANAAAALDWIKGKLAEKTASQPKVKYVPYYSYNRNTATYRPVTPYRQ